MRKTINIFTIITILCSVLSCANDNNESEVETSALNIHATIHRTVIAKQTFVHDDCIGIYLVAYNNGVPGLLGDINLTREANVEYAYDNSGYWYSKNGRDLFLDDEPSDLYAYHPYDEEMSIEPSKANLTAYPFTVESNQEMSGGESSDFLWAKIPGLSTSNPIAPIVFQHLMCRCEINIRLADGIEVTDIPALEVNNVQRSCTINLRNGETTPTGASGTIIPSNNSRVTTGYDYTYDAIVVPQVLTRNTTFLNIVLNGETFLFQLPRDITLVSQQCYIFNLVAGHSPSQSPSNLIMVQETD